MTRSQMIETVARKTGFTEAQVETKVSSRLESTSIPGFKASGRFKQKLEAGKAKAAEENA